MEFEREYLEKELNRDYVGLGESSLNGEELEEEEIIKFTEEPQDNKILIIKGDDEMIYRSEFLQESIEAFLEQAVEPEFFSVEKSLTESTRKTLREAFDTLNRYKVDIKANKELRDAIFAIAKYIGFGYPSPEPSPAKKGLEKREAVDWVTIRNQLFGELVSGKVEVEKSDIGKDDPFPSISKQIDQNIRDIEEVVEENNIEERERFI